MSTKDSLKRIDELQHKIDSYGKLPDDILKKIQYRFRLDWNYHSNAIEGNSLTQQETRSVMVNNVTIDGKPLKDIMDMRGHDNVVTDILRIGKGELRFSEKRMKEIHAAIIYEDDPEQKKKVGKWKTQDNYLTNYRGERFDFVSWADVPEKIHELIDWLNREYEKVSRSDVNAMHPVILAFEFHLRYVTIHPFYDGNGRTARLFMNLILISFGFPPVVVEINEKEKYGQYLADIQAYGGSPDLFYNFMCSLLIRSQELVLDAIEGKDISKPDDFESELLLMEGRLKYSQAEVVNRSPELVRSIFKASIWPLLAELYEKLGKIDHLFTDNKITVSNDNTGRAVKNISEYETVLFQNVNDEKIHTIDIRFNWIGFNRAGIHTFSSHYAIHIAFEQFKYRIQYGNNDNSDTSITKLYSEELAEKEKKLVLDFVPKYVLSSIKAMYKQLTGEEI